MIPIIDTEGILHALCYVFEKQYLVIEDRLRKIYYNSEYSILISEEQLFPTFDKFYINQELLDIRKDLYKLDKLIESRIENKFREIFNYCKANYFCGFIHGIGNYRKYVDPTYKANRKGERPICLDRIVKIAEQRYKLYRVDNIEVDDAVIITYNHYKEQGLDVVIVTPDKDLDQCAGKHLKIRKDGLEYFENTEQEASDILFKSLITGDTADNIKGIEGKGEVFANDTYIMLKQANKLSYLFTHILMEYINKYGELEGTHRFSKTFQLMYMLRKPERGFIVPQLIKLT